MSSSFTYKARERCCLQAGGSSFSGSQNIPSFPPVQTKEFPTGVFQNHAPSLAVFVIFLSLLSWCLLQPSYLSFPPTRRFKHPKPVKSPLPTWTPYPLDNVAGLWWTEMHRLFQLPGSAGELHTSFYCLSLLFAFPLRLILCDRLWNTAGGGKGNTNSISYGTWHD